MTTTIGDFPRKVRRTTSIRSTSYKAISFLADHLAKTRARHAGSLVRWGRGRSQAGLISQSFNQRRTSVGLQCLRSTIQGPGHSMQPRFPLALQSNRESRYTHVDLQGLAHFQQPLGVSPFPIQLNPRSSHSALAA